MHLSAFNQILGYGITEAMYFPIFGSGTDLISLLILFFFLSGWALQKKPRLSHFKSDSYKIWKDCSSSKRID